MPRKLLMALVIVLLFFQSCVPLAEVHDYASSSVLALNKINNIDYTFRDYCRQDCELQQLRSGEIQPSFACSCTEAATNADTAVQKIYLTVKAYLTAIDSLSNNKNFSYNVTDLSKSLEKSALLNLNEQQKSISIKAGNFIATAATAYYRKKKLKQYLGQADSLFQNVTETLLFLVDNRLRAQLKFAYDARLANAKQLLDNTTDRGVKQAVVQSYLDEKHYFTKHNTLIDTYVAILKLVQKGYHDLYIHHEKLSRSNIKELLNHHLQDLQYLIDSIN